MRIIDIRLFRFRFAVEVKFRRLATRLGGRGKPWTDAQKRKQSLYLKKVWKWKKARALKEANAIDNKTFDKMLKNL